MSQSVSISKTCQANPSDVLRLPEPIIAMIRPYWDKREIETGIDWCHRWESSSQTSNKLSAWKTDEKHLISNIEEKFLQRFGIADGLAVATGSGRVGLWLALQALMKAFPHRNQVIIPSFACPAILDPILQSGLIPVFADIGDALNVTDETVAPLINACTLAIVVIHLGGKHATDLQRIQERASTHQVAVIDDVCQAVGGQSNGVYWGATSDLSLYSFSLGKSLMATGGGMLIARGAYRDLIAKERHRLDLQDSSLAKTRFNYLYHNYITPVSPKEREARPMDSYTPIYEEPLRMSGLDAALLSHQLEKMPEIVSKRTAHAQHLIAAGIEDSEAFQVVGQQVPSMWTKLTLQLSPKTGLTVQKLRDTLWEKGIEIEAMYRPLHQQDCGSPYSSNNLPNTERLAPGLFNLPVRPNLSPGQLDTIATELKKVGDLLG